jgi:hypothetical protein
MDKLSIRIKLLVNIRYNHRKNYLSPKLKGFCTMRSLFLKLFKYTSLFFVVLYSFIWLISPSITRFYSADFLQLLSQNHLALSEKSSIRYNPFLSHLSIYDLALVKKDQNKEVVLSVNELQLEVSLYKLLFDQLHISEFKIDGLFIKVNIEGEKVDVAGITLIDPNATEAEQEIIEEAEQEASKLMVKMAEFTLLNAKINTTLNGHEHLFDIKSLIIERVSASAKTQQVSVLLKAALNQAPLSLNINAQLHKGVGEISSYFSLEQLELNRFEQFLPEQISALSGKINVQSKQEIKLTEEEVTIAVKLLEITTDQLIVQQNEVSVTIEKQAFSNNNLLIKLAKNDTIHIQGTALFELNNLTVATQEQDQVLAHLTQLTFSDINFNIADQQASVNIASIDFSQFYASDYLSNDIPPLAQFSLLTIEQLAITEKSLAITKIKLAGLTVDAQLNEDKALSNLVTLPMPAEEVMIEEESLTTEQPDAMEKQKIAPPEFALSVGEFSFTDDAHINFIDHSIKPIFERHIIISKLTAGPIDNQAPDKKSLYEVVGNSEQYAYFNFSGFAQPFLAQPVYHVKGDFKELSLPAVSTYMKEALQYVFDSGQLDLSLDTTLTGTEIDGEMLVLMRGLELTAAEDDEVNSISDQGAIPFSMALGMLKDSNGNVELDIPLSGDTSAPSFGMSGFVSLLIKQATMMAAKDYLMTTFVPYANVISIAMTAGDYLLKIRFNDLTFPATQTELQPEHSEFLAQFSALLKDRADEHITLCAIAIAQDIGKEAGTEITNKDELSQLKKISLARMHAFKSYMVKTEQLASSRLLLCTPQVDSSVDAKARITFTN